LAFDHERGSVELLGSGPGLSEGDVAFALAGSDEPAENELTAPAEPPQLPCTFDAAGYRRAVDEARTLIRQGALFEVNLSRRYTAPEVDPGATYRAMRALAPAPFMADLDLGAGRRLLSSSPERFLSLSADGHVSSWPIKGTRPRDRDPARDAEQREALLESSKEKAELAMIVDLVRSDLGRVAQPGSVRVTSPRRVQSWPTVHHTVAVVEADLDEGFDWADLVRGAFPPGSVTGAPKIRAMEVIDDLEPVRRGLYCGSFGYVGFDGAADLAVAIRIVHCDGERAHVHAGGAVLLKSDPDEEERETLAKARALLRGVAVGRASARVNPRG
jgi:para-aminobenzoate synthetase component 1